MGFGPHRAEKERKKEQDEKINKKSINRKHMLGLNPALGERLFERVQSLSHRGALLYLTIDFWYYCFFFLFRRSLYYPLIV